MKKLLLMVLVGTCAAAWRAPDVMRAWGLPAVGDTVQAENVQGSPPSSAQDRISAAEFLELSKTDPHAYQKYLHSHIEQPAGRNEVDKLMNFFARGKYE